MGVQLDVSKFKLAFKTTLNNICIHTHTHTHQYNEPCRKVYIMIFEVTASENFLFARLAVNRLKRGRDVECKLSSCWTSGSLK